MVTGGALAGFWVIPFLLRLPYTNDMGWEKINTIQDTLLVNGKFTWVVVIAAIGGVTSLLQRHCAGIFLSVMAVLSWIGFATAPQGRLWNARLLPFWFLCIWLMAGLAVAEVWTFLADAIGSAEEYPSERGRRAMLLAGPIVLLVGALVYVSFPLHILPGGHTDKATGEYRWMGVRTTDRSFVSDWVRWNYSGYESKAKSRHDEYFALMGTMARVGQREGCGRAMWEYEEELDGMGTPMAPMLMPYWTHGCIGSMEGLFFESSATTPYHFLNQSELSSRPSRAQRDLPYENVSVAEGVRHLQLLGVKYYMALSPDMQNVADHDSDLHLVATSGPWTVHYSNGDQQRTWKIYEVAHSEEVAPLSFQPAVMQNLEKGAKPGLNPSGAWSLDRSGWSIPPPPSGPKEWPRVQIDAAQPDEHPVPPVAVSNIKLSDDRISF